MELPWRRKDAIKAGGTRTAAGADEMDRGKRTAERSHHKETEDMNQAQTEALIRLMLAARYADKKITLSETDAFQKQAEKLPWNSGTGQSLFVQQATAEVRKALATEEARQEFVRAQCAQFPDSESGLAVVRQIEALLAADGVDEKENEFLRQIRGALKA